MCIVVICPRCETRFQARKEYAGRSTKCPSCGHTLVLQSQDDKENVDAAGDPSSSKPLRPPMRIPPRRRQQVQIEDSSQPSQVIRPVRRKSWWRRPPAVGIMVTVMLFLLAASACLIVVFRDTDVQSTSSRANGPDNPKHELAKAVSRAQPLGYFMANSFETASGFAIETNTLSRNEGVFLGIIVSVPAAAFAMSAERELTEDQVHTVKGYNMKDLSSYSREQRQVYESYRFTILLHDGSKRHASMIAPWPFPLLQRGFAPECLYVFSHVRYRAEERVVLAVGVVVEHSRAKPPFLLQLDDDDPVKVPSPDAISIPDDARQHPIDTVILPPTQAGRHRF